MATGYGAARATRLLWREGALRNRASRDYQVRQGFFVKLGLCFLRFRKDQEGVLFELTSELSKLS